MLRKLFESSDGSIKWIDLVNPSDRELRSIATQYSLHPKSVEHCLDPEHLPKFEVIGDVMFLIARAFDDRSEHNDTMQQLTRKLAIFIGRNFLITVHRRDQHYLNQVFTTFTASSTADFDPLAMATELLQAVVKTFEMPVDHAQTDMDQIEMSLFSTSASRGDLRTIYYLKRRLKLIDRCLRGASIVIEEFCEANEDRFTEMRKPYIRDLNENIERLRSQTNQLLDDARSLINVQISLATKGTNDVLQTLTLFSVFFMPLTFIAGIYGMNFEYMPELKLEIGYPIILIVMAVIALGLWIFFRRKGWLK